MKRKHYNIKINQFITSSTGLRAHNLTISHLDSMLVRVASHAHPVYMLFKHFGGQRHSKGIREIVCKCYFGDGNVTFLHNLSDQMILPLYLLLLLCILSSLDWVIVPLLLQ